MKRDGGPVACFIATLVALCGAPSRVQAAPQTFDIPAGPAGRSLTLFAQQAGAPIAVPYELTSTRRTQRVRGRMEPDEALRRLLRGSGLKASRDANGQIVITAAPAPRPRAEAPPVPEPPLWTEATELDEVAVTGSRIEALGMTTPTPVTALTLDELEALSPATLAEALVELPLFLNNDTPQSQSFGTSAAAGSSYMNLRGIGSIRTLTLIDGRRVVPATRFGTVDYALLPKALLRRVEVVTGGASAAYGSDAVSGVVNLQLNSRFEGLRLRVQGGLSGRHDNGNGEFSLTMGTRIGEHSHLILSGELYQAGGVRGYGSRDWFDSSAVIANPTAVAGEPRVITARNVRATGYTYGGLITSGPLADTQFLPGGVPAPFLRGQYYTATTQSGGDGVDPARDLIWLMPDQLRLNGFAKLTTQVTPGFSVFAQVLAGHSDNAFDMAPPSLWGPNEITIYPENAFLPTSIRDRMQTEGIASFRMGRVGRDDMGRNRVNNVGNLLSATVGASKALGSWQADAYYQYGTNHNLLRYTDTLRIDRVYRALDSVIDPATGEAMCRSTLMFPDDGCVPVNPFGEGSVSPAARAWITEGSYEQSQVMQQHVAEFTLQGSAFDLPAGRVQVATGINWRGESVRNTPRRFPAELEGVTIPPASTLGYRGLPAAYLGSSILFERTVVNRVAGRYHVWEAFGEAIVPLLAQRPYIEQLTLHGALRYARYSGSGTEPAWKAGLDWRVDGTLRLRATRSRDVRAGSLSERFDTSGSGTTIYDAGLPTPAVYPIVSVRTGNPAVKPERANTWTGGLVFTPNQVRDLSISADYYDIRVRGAIGVLGAQNILNRCQAGQDDYCALITRSSSTGLIQRVNNLVLNITEARTRGIDLEMGWRVPVTLHGSGNESIALRLFANRMLESSVTGISGIKFNRTDQNGVVGGAPMWQANFSVAYQRDPLRISVQQRLISGGRFNAAYLPGSIDNNEIPAVSYTNLRAAWTLRAPQGLTVFAQVSNLFDQDPPRAPEWGFGGSIPTNETLYDVIGRRYVLGVTLAR